MNDTMYDVIIVGSGPSGLSCALSCKKRKLKYLVLEKGVIANSIYNFPISMLFFTTKELIEIGDYPLNIFNAKPTREEALNYYARFVVDNKININTFEEVKEIQGISNNFKIQTLSNLNKNTTYKCKKIILATGVFDNPRMLNIPGEKLAKVSHYYKEAHPYINKNVLIIGGRNSAVEAGLEIYRRGGSVSIVHRGSAFSNLKYWVEPDILNRIEENSIKCYYNATVKEIQEKKAIIKENGKEISIDNDFVLALTGYEPNSKLLRKLKVSVSEDTLKPTYNKTTFESNTKGVYIAGTLVAGSDSSLVFIENGRLHGEEIVPHIKASITKELAN